MLFHFSFLLFLTACNCNSKSNKCFFDQDLYDRTGHGGHCLECRENTAGVNCEKCKDLYFRPSPSEQCRPCQCDPTGEILLGSGEHVDKRKGAGAGEGGM